MLPSPITIDARLNSSCRKLPAMRKPARPGIGRAAEAPGAAASAAGNTSASAAGNVRRAVAPVRTGAATKSGAASAGGRGGRIPAAPRRGVAASAKPLGGAARERVPDQAAGSAVFGPLAAGRLHGSSTAQVIRLSLAGMMPKIEPSHI